MQINIPWLEQSDTEFPSVTTALLKPNGLLACGVDLSPERLITAYQSGIFPWYDESQPIMWWSPDPRALLFMSEVKISRSLHKVLKAQKFNVTADTAFAQVIEACSLPRKEESETWITQEMKHAYLALHQNGFAHSIEVWLEDDLVGGLYGVSLGGAYFGESMFSQVSNASKVALVHLCGQLQQWDFDFIDCQIPNPHLMSLGCQTLPREKFMTLLQHSMEKPTRQGNWTVDWTYCKG